MSTLVTLGTSFFFVVIVYICVEFVWQFARRLRSGRAQAAAPDWGFRMQEAAEKHLAAVNEALAREEEGEAEVDSPAFGPYCGCETCMVREILAGAWPVMAEMVDYTRNHGLTLALLDKGHDA